MAGVLHDQTVSNEFVLAWNTCLLGIARIAGISLTLPHVPFKTIQDFDPIIVGEASLLYVSREGAWGEYTRRIRDAGPDDVETKRLRALHEELNLRCLRFAAQHPAEWSLAVAILSHEVRP